MTLFVKIDRLTGDVLRAKEAKNMKRVFDKAVAWIRCDKQKPPAFDKETHKKIRTISQPDLSDLSVKVPATAKRIESWDIVPLSAQELADLKNNKIAATDHLMARFVEDILVNVAKGVPLTREAFPDKVWGKINRRRVLRGQEPV